MVLRIGLYVAAAMLWLGAVLAPVVTAFPLMTSRSATKVSFATPTTTAALSPLSGSNENGETENNKPFLSMMASMGQKAVLSGLVAATMWSTPLAGNNIPFLPQTTTSMADHSMVANAKEMASGSGSRVNKDPESLLRYGLPIKNKEVSTYCIYLRQPLKRSHKYAL